MLHLLDRFAEATDDHQWIHVDPERAKAESPLGTTIAHGFLSLSLLARFGYELGLRPKELHIPHSTITEKFYTMVGANIGEGITGTTHEALFKHGDKDAYFALRKRSGLSGFEAGWTSLRFIALEALTRAIEQAGSLDRAKVMAALRGLHYETLHGPLAFSFGVEVAGKKVDGVGNKLVFPAQWQNGKIEVLWPVEVATSKYRPRQ